MRAPKAETRFESGASAERAREPEQTSSRELQAPPLWHGEEAHSSRSTQCVPLPLVPGRHSQKWRAAPVCESEQQHVVILVRNQGLSHLEKDRMG